jgi:DNA polymerase-1
MEERPILIVDGYNLFVRHFMANDAVTTVGDPCGGVVGFIKALHTLVRQFNPVRLYVVWEQGGGCPRRKKLFPEYKANRLKVSSEFKAIGLPENGLPSKKWIKDDKENKLTQTKHLVASLKHLPVCQLYVADAECDDVIAYLVKNKLKSVDAMKIIVSSDRDFYQLLEDPNVQIFNPADKSLHGGPVVKVKVGKDEFIGVPAKNYALVRTLTGDDSDNIPGVPGFGFKTAVKLFPELLTEDTERSVSELVELAQTKSTEKKALKGYGSVVACADMIWRNWKLMFLSESTLSYEQIKKIDNAVENFQPATNKMGLIKTLLDAKIVSSINYDAIVYDMQITLGRTVENLHIG